MMKKYKLHCFGCGHQFHSKKDVYRGPKPKRYPYCGECMAYYDTCEYEMAVEEEWYRNNPGKDPEEEHRKQVYLSKYGEY